MIKEGKIVSLPEIELGNLGLHNACSYYVPKDPKEYPKAFFERKTKKVTHCTIEADSPENCPRGYTVREQWDTPFERLIDYAGELKEEHADLTDAQINKSAPFIGRKRSARWEDERKRRGLTK